MQTCEPHLSLGVNYCRGNCGLGFKQLMIVGQIYTLQREKKKEKVREMKNNWRDDNVTQAKAPKPNKTCPSILQQAQKDILWLQRMFWSFGKMFNKNYVTMSNTAPDGFMCFWIIHYTDLGLTSPSNHSVYTNINIHPSIYFCLFGFFSESAQTPLSPRQS